MAIEPLSVTFHAADGMRISADYYPPPPAHRTPAPFVILLHACRENRESWRPLITPLHDAGFAVLAPDLRGHGDSATTETRQAVEDRDPELFRKMQEDLRGAYDWLAEQPGLDRARFALVGAGVGCSVALQYAAHDRSVDAVVGLSPALNDLGLDAGGDISQVSGRKVLLLAAEDGRDVPYTLQKRGSGVEVRISAGGPAHETGLLAVSGDLGSEIARYLKLAVGEPTRTTVYGSINSNVYHLPESAWLKRILPTNLRYYSSPQEAESRGLRAARAGQSSPRDGASGRDRRNRGRTP